VSERERERARERVSERARERVSERGLSEPHCRRDRLERIVVVFRHTAIARISERVTFRDKIQVLLKISCYVRVIWASS